MTKTESTVIATLIRRKEGVGKSLIKEHAAKILAQFEAQVSTIYPENDPRWALITEKAREQMREVSAKLSQICLENGIPPNFAPTLNLSWYGRGENAIKERRAELRRAAVAKIAALEATAMRKLECWACDAHTRLVSGQLESPDARTFLEAMPTAESTMPVLNLEEVEAVKPLPILDTQSSHDEDF